VVAGAGALALAMVRRFLRSRAAAEMAEALAAGRDVRREAAFHARIRFPGGAVVQGFDSLLVKGSVDLWLPDADGRVRVLDHKTNSPRGGVVTPAALAGLYGTQIRLYALAAERVTGREVAGGDLLLLDPGFGDDLEVPVDVSGPALEDARRLCQAYALAMLHQRFPPDWRALLALA